MANNRNSGEVVFEIVRNLGIINSYQNGWNKELNVVAWNGGAPKYDIRDWDPTHEHMNRGITLHQEEITSLYKIVQERIIKAGDRLQPGDHSGGETNADSSQATA